MFRHIRSKLIAAFAVPLAILVAVAGLEAVTSLKQITSVDQQTALASASVGPGGALQDLQTERLYAILDIVKGAGQNVAPALQGINPAAGGLYRTPAQIMGATSGQLESFRSAVGSAGSAAITAYTPAFNEIGTLAKVRGYWAAAAAGHPVPNYETVAQETYQGYTTIIDSLINGVAQVPLQISDPTLRTGVEALYTSLEKTESQYSILQDLFVASWSSGQAEKNEIDATIQAWGADQAFGQRLTSMSRPPYSAAIDTLNANPVDATIQLDLSLLQVEGIPSFASLLGVFTQPAQVSSAQQAHTTATNAALGDQQIAAVVTARAAVLHNDAVEKAIAFAGVGAAGIILGFLMVVLVSRSISRPLVDLARQAELLATDTLPATVQAILDAGASGGELPKAPKVSVNSRDEVAGMARALEAVNKTAIDMAAGQAALRKSLADAFVNLGRRNQNLVTRQLEYISEIELKEADPESLEELFRLDHLATRMRRNAESLLILAGSGPARQWSAAVPAMDVARAASAEVEDYKRLRLHHFDPAMITGAVTTDLVHIMAELTENALTFSPPGAPVDIYGRFLEGAYVIVIVDSGIGMSADDLDVANRRLEGDGSSNDVPGRYLGHFVAGRLARRHGISISLQASHSGGLVGRVKIPADLIEGPVPDLSAVAEVRSAQAASSAPGTSFEPADFNDDELDDAPRGASGGAVPFVIPDSLAEALSSGKPLSGSSAAPEVDDELLNGKADEGSTDEDYASLTAAVEAAGHDNGKGYANNGHMPEWAGDITEPSWDAEAEVDSDLKAAAVDEVAHDNAPEVEDWDAIAAALPVPGPAPAPVAKTSPPVVAKAAPLVAAPRPAPPVVADKALPPVAVAKAVPTPDLGANAPLVVGTVLPVEAPTSAPSWDPVADHVSAAPAVGPGAQARNTADGLRKLTRRVPGASLPVEDDSLRRATPATTGHSPVGLSGALSQYLSATTNEGRTEKEHNAR